jgi:hypothetical protein
MSLHPIATPGTYILYKSILLLLYSAEVIDLAEMIVQMVQELDQDVSMGIFRTVELDRKFGFHLGIGDVAEGGGDQRDKLLKLSNQLLPGHGLSGKFLVAIADIAAVGEDGAEKMVQAADEVQDEVAA